MSAALVRLENASVRYREQTVLQTISLELKAGEIVTVIGPNGAGKSTLVKLANGLIAPTEGRVYRKPKLRIGYMPQRLSFDASLPLTVQRFLSLCNRDAAQVAAAQTRLGIGHLRDTAVHVLSGGELQRVLLARALLRQPQLLVLDEPVQGVDVNGQTELYGLITALRNELGCGVLMVSHDLHLVMADTDRVVCLNHHICCEGKPENVSTDPAYLQLFGHKTEGKIAVYTHQHDHSHDLHGDIVGANHEHSPHHVHHDL